MKLKKLIIDHFRSIEHIEIDFPIGVPLILFGPNNTGKSNILQGIENILGEKYANYIEFEDNDYFLRQNKLYPNISFKAIFDGNIKSSYPESSTICFTTNHKFRHYKTKENLIENTFHYEDGGQMFLKNEEREQCQFILINASRDINRQFSYFSQYSVLSRLTKKMHGVLVEKTKIKLDEHFKSIKSTFELVPEYKNFLNKLQSSFKSNANGFEHKLDIDLSAYDPNNYFHSLRIIAKEGEAVRSFSELGTGEQQILLISFIKAYAETFKGEHFILGIEEPEAHLHPLAQRWLAKNIENICENGAQVIITTHSPEFLNIENLSGFVKVYKENNLTKILQHSPKSLVESCVNLGANSDKTSEKTILRYYRSNTFYEQLRGFFAKKIILVEGPTELFSLQNYFTNCGYDLVKNGVEIIDCKGKSQIARNYRLFFSYGYTCFCLFDADESDSEKKRANKELAEIFKFDPENLTIDKEKFVTTKGQAYGYFGKDYENYLRANLNEYSEKEKQIEGEKVLIAKIISEENVNYKPQFINNIAEYLELELRVLDNAPIADQKPSDNIPF
ncbi:hypothetical protein A2334_03540 [Candidatus Roizmanbacteria bacterium RIFOXYB2_FULL_38_10]|uniref:Uncharacterized protein n=1 Tax=Candidatus Roizmanbacteria bacterium RIFOXYD1_FULL_38_12 TaxID=1802093 RepID=A0A1F7L0X8_9BACT|nr:MAG: hypothetical protein A3K47_03305 [Candidatus Roizmanbacteria bacterium RIFOXYA2_FULL_38_14]OGK63792.1 MAG: hypothetical protein A3K27_03305 [Candidatus Roizmanbacteria bacterium RIFOXYA1_FULL_37_12]OGK65638.1 MAG: hypothetical protein A3K38_03305 [Candidatus Roizmanbacteria bacterium RIFOXYB1_FULL_40_23]OGK67474.1 MAG: hypothetical protein A2334_03540 [Candidatus Roizmanbacteria bacterium RIFOXYB2_FULL_38_10]OGK70043.1 MAG: hypothetical protein A3K21_03310 [Candidatus Roizmanbacteria ba